MQLNLLAVFAALLCVSTAEKGKAHLLVSKMVLNEHLVQNKDITIEYRLFNIGDGAALDVQLTDDIPPDTLTHSHGLVSVKWDRISPGSNVTHAAIMRAPAEGVVNFTSAVVEYLDTEVDGERRRGASSEPGPMYVLALAEYDRQYSPHILDWGLFGLMTLPSLGIPYLLWLSSCRKYEAVMRQSTKKSN